jgi:hypothetical protein
MVYERMEAVIYHRDGDAESQVMREYLRGLMIECRMRQIDNGDRAARRDWEDLDGEVTPLLVMDQRQIVRGFDRTRVDQLVGWIGC